MRASHLNLNFPLGRISSGLRTSQADKSMVLASVFCDGINIAVTVRLSGKYRKMFASL